MKSYLKYIRRQSKHIQHIHAFIFAGSITFVIAAVILYYDYGFWHEHYNRDTDVVAATSTSSDLGLNESPLDALSRFFKEAKNQFNSITSTSGGILEGRESYSKGADQVATSTVVSTSTGQ